MLLWLVGPAGEAAAQPSCLAEAASPAPVLGLNRTNLAWADDWPIVLQAMSDAGARHVRFTMNPPFAATVDTILAAGALNMSVLLDIPLGYREFYPPDVAIRSGEGRFLDQPGLSDVDVEKYRSALSEFLLALERGDGRIAAIEVGNEINWTDFNGDMPLDRPGRVVGRADFASWPAALRVTEGFRRYAALLEATRTVLASTRAHRDIPVIAGGIVDFGPAGPTTSGGTSLTPDLVASLYASSGASDFVDGYAVHVYPDAQGDPAEQEAIVYRALDRATAPFCGPQAVARRPCWITEWGFPVVGDPCTTDDGPRLERARSFLRVASCLAHSRPVAASFLYTWDQSPEHGIYLCGRRLDAAAIFRAPAP